MNIKKIICYILFTVFILSNVSVFAESSIQYNIDRNKSEVVNYCAYNGNTYVLVGNGGLISVSSDLTNWQEIKGACYTDIEKIIWDGNNFVFLSDYNLYKSPDGYLWTKSACDFTYTSDFAFADGKYIVHKPTEKNARGLASAPVGLTSDFINFEEINFDTALENTNLTYPFTPLLSYIDGVYFATGLTSNIVYSLDLINWSNMPVLPNKDNSLAKRLLFTSMNNEILMYYYDDSKIICYSISRNNMSEWKQTIIEIGHVWSSATMQKLNNEIYIFNSFDSVYKSTDAYTFEKVNVSADDGYFILNKHIPLKVIKGTMDTTFAYRDNNNIVGHGVQNPVSFESSLMWTGKEYLKHNSAEGIVYKSSDRRTLSESEISSENYKSFRSMGSGTEKELLWDGSRYIARITGYEVPKLRGGALEDGRKLFIFDETLNLLDEVVFEGDVCAMSFINGKYFVKIGDLSDKEKYYIYSSSDLSNWIVEENLTEIPVSNGKSELLFEFDRTDSVASYTRRDKIKQSNIKLDNQIFSEIDYETDSQNYTTVIDGIYISKMITEDGVYIGFSDDGVYYNKVKLPDDYLILALRGTTNKTALFYDIGDAIAYEEYGLVVRFDKAEIKSSFKQKEHTYVKVSDKVLGFDTEPVIESDRTLVPLRFIFETLGADVDWEEATRTAIVQNDEATILFSIDNTAASVNSVTKSMDVPARLVNDKTMVPLRFLSEELGFNVEWDEATRTATISR